MTDECDPNRQMPMVCVEKFNELGNVQATLVERTAEILRHVKGISAVVSGDGEPGKSLVVRVNTLETQRGSITFKSLALIITVSAAVAGTVVGILEYLNHLPK